MGPGLKATLKKKFVSCTASGRNYGQSGGRKLFFFFSFFFFFGKKIVKIILNNLFLLKMRKKRSQSALIDSPGRWTGNNIFSKGGLRDH